MSNSIAQEIKYRQSLMKYVEKYGVSRASHKYNKGRSYIYFWRSRWDGTAESLACQSRKPTATPTSTQRKNSNSSGICTAGILNWALQSFGIV